MTSRSTDDGERKPPTLPQVVAELVNPTTVRVLVERRSPTDGSLVIERPEHTVRPVLAELRAAVMPSGQSGGGGRGGGLPLSLEALDVLEQIRDLVDVELGRLGLTYRSDDRPCSGCQTPFVYCRRALDPATGLRVIGVRGLGCCSRCHHAVAVDPLEDALRRLAVHPWPPAQQDTREAFRRRLQSLTDRAASMLAGDPDAERVRDTRCPKCKAEYVHVDRGAGVERVPPLRIERSKLVEYRDEPGVFGESDGRRGPVRGTRCDGCHRFWPWEAMQGPRAGAPAGALWELIVHDALEVARLRAYDQHRRRELANREYANGVGPSAAELGLPRFEPVPPP